MKKDLSMKKEMLLVELQKKGSASWSDLMGSLNISRATLSRILKPLLKEKKVEKQLKDGKIVYAIVGKAGLDLPIQDLIELNKSRLKDISLLKEMGFFSKGVDNKRILDFLKQEKEFIPLVKTLMEKHEKQGKLELTWDLFTLFSMIVRNSLPLKNVVATPLNVVFSAKTDPGSVIKTLQNNIKLLEKQGKGKG